MGRGGADALSHTGRLDAVQGLVQAGNGREGQGMGLGMLIQGRPGQHRDQKKDGRYGPLLPLPPMGMLPAGLPLNT